MDDSLEQMGREVAGLQDDWLRQRESASIAERAERLRRTAARRAARRKAAVVVLPLLVAAAALVLFFRTERAPLAFDVGRVHAPGQAGRAIESREQATALRFSDGTRIELAKETAARVVSSTSDGARVALDRGELRADVVHRPRSAWTVAAGPFEVHVTGTSFDVAWDPATEVLRMKIYEGKVLVTGPCVSDGRTLVANEGTELSCKPPPMTAVAAPSARPEPGSNGVAPEIPEQVANAAMTAPAPSKPPEPRPIDPGIAPLPPAAADAEAAPVPPAVSWQDRARAGELEAAMVRVEAGNVEDILAKSSPGDLLLLGDTARLQRRDALATRAYALARERAPGTEGTARAAFELGRLDVDANRLQDARKWFVAYLDEQPRGQLALEALGRLMEIERDLRNLAAARRYAKAYLAIAPQGPWAVLARSLLLE
jgi:hypothetical protein